MSEMEKLAELLTEVRDFVDNLGHSNPPTTHMRARDLVSRLNSALAALRSVPDLPSEEEIQQVVMLHQNCGFGSDKPDKRMLCNDASLHPLMEHRKSCECAATASALFSLLRTRSPSDEGWRPIESAPKDGTLQFLVLFRSGYIAHVYLTTPEPPLAQTFRHCGGPMSGQQAGWPTHWRPLPAPPSDGGKTQKDE